MNTNKKKFHFTWVDAVIAVVVIVLIAVLCVKVLGGRSSRVEQSETQTITYTVSVPAVRSGTISALAEGDTLFDKDTGAVIGTITKVDFQVAKTKVTRSDGTAVRVLTEDRYDAVLTIEAEGVVSAERSYLVNRTYQVNVGSKRNLCTKYASWEGKILSIEQ